MDFKEILELIKFVSKSGVEEVKLENGTFKITIRTSARAGNSITKAEIAAPTLVTAQPVVVPVTQSPAVTPAPAVITPSLPDETSRKPTIKSPMVGTFYRSPAPNKPPFVNVGDEIKKGQVVCVIEAMKLFNDIESDIDGKILKILVDDAKPVEFDQPLFLIESH